MRWNCPHCGTSLAVADDKLGNSWSFSRCYKCAGFALVRKSEANLIKVDRAPSGEQVLLPEAHEDPTTMLSKSAAEHLSRYIGPNAAQKPATAAEKPSIRTAARRVASMIAPAKIPNAVNVQAEALAQAQSQVRAEAQEKARHQAVIQAEVEAHAARKKAAAAATTAAVQPPKFQHPSLPSLPSKPPIVQRPEALSTRPMSFGLALPEPLPEKPSMRGIRDRMVPALITLTGVGAITFGIYLYVQGQSMWQRARNEAALAYSNPISDQVTTKAMAPARGSPDKAPDSSTAR